MPELPEVETLRKKITPKLKNQRLMHIKLRRKDLRYPFPKGFKKCFENQKISEISRRSKYLLLEFDHGRTMILHLGMSGRFFFTEADRVLDKHDHVVFDFENGLHMRFRDPRRFGMILESKTSEIQNHKMIQNLGVEPLLSEFNEKYFFGKIKGSQASIKNLLMNAKVVVGVGNIYANEALFLSGIRPTRRGSRVTKEECKNLVKNVKAVLKASLKSGGTTFRDYVDANENPGLHQLRLFVYGRKGEVCKKCNTLIKRVVQTNRSSFYCPKCQK